MKKNLPDVVTLSQWNDMKRYVVFATIKLKSESKPFNRAFGPFPTRVKAGNVRNKFIRELKQAENVQSFTVTTTVLWSEAMYRNQWEIIPDGN